MFVLLEVTGCCIFYVGQASDVKRGNGFIRKVHSLSQIWEISFI